MSINLDKFSKSSPPTFSGAKNRRQRVCASGMNPDYWYAVEYENAIKRGQVVEVQFWKTSIALYRGQDGKLRALENRCPHRQLKLSLGEVNGCHLACCYHGWQYNEEGQLVEIPHEISNSRMPFCKIKTYPVKVRFCQRYSQS
jgi:phenylpropionate dioxygenase-like ring-hydroxylating dioxygenase large terminal subunit